MKTTAKRKGKKEMWIFLGVVGVIALGLAAGILIDAPRRNEVKSLTFADLDGMTLRDGTYIGEYKATRSNLSNTEVQVTVSAGKIAEIKVLKGAVNKEGKPVKMSNGLTIDNLFDRVIKSQSLQVDVISGATVTSKAHLKAVENALGQAQIK